MVTVPKAPTETPVTPLTPVPAAYPFRVPTDAIVVPVGMLVPEILQPDASPRVPEAAVITALLAVVVPEKVAFGLTTIRLFEGSAIYTVPDEATATELGVPKPDVVTVVGVAPSIANCDPYPIPVRGNWKVW
jgi:hypothetical protein